MKGLIVTGTGTDVGKTMVAAGLLNAFARARYWKPVQAGTDGGTDRQRVLVLSGAGENRLLPEARILQTPASPHLAARIDGVTIRPDSLTLPDCPEPLIVEGAGGVMVPVTERWLMIDLFAQWRLPVLLVASTGLGTINHSLLSLQLLRQRGLEVAGVLFVGEPHAENERIIPALANVRHLGRLPWLDAPGLESLNAAMRAHADLDTLSRWLA